MTEQAKRKFREWTVKASDDEKAIKVLLQNRGPANTVCFLTQQMGEKYLKAFLIAKKGKFPKIHGLNLLLQLCEEKDKTFSRLKAEAAFLDDFYIETRYPGFPAEFSLQDARSAYQSVLKIKKFVLSKLKD